MSSSTFDEFDINMLPEAKKQCFETYQFQNVLSSSDALLSHLSQIVVEDASIQEKIQKVCTMLAYQATQCTLQARFFQADCLFFTPYQNKLQESDFSCVGVVPFAFQNHIKVYLQQEESKKAATYGLAAQALLLAFFNGLSEDLVQPISSTLVSALDSFLSSFEQTIYRLRFLDDINDDYCICRGCFSYSSQHSKKTKAVKYFKCETCGFWYHDTCSLHSIKQCFRCSPSKSKRKRPLSSESALNVQDIELHAPPQKVLVSNKELEAKVQHLETQIQLLSSRSSSSTSDENSIYQVEAKAFQTMKESLVELSNTQKTLMDEVKSVQTFHASFKTDIEELVKLQKSAVTSLQEQQTAFTHSLAECKDTLQSLKEQQHPPTPSAPLKADVEPELKAIHDQLTQTEAEMLSLQEKVPVAQQKKDLSTEALVQQEKHVSHCSDVALRFKASVEANQQKIRDFVHTIQTIDHDIYMCNKNLATKNQERSQAQSSPEKCHLLPVLQRDCQELEQRLTYLRSQAQHVQTQLVFAQKEKETLESQARDIHSSFEQAVEKLHFMQAEVAQASAAVTSAVFAVEKEKQKLADLQNQLQKHAEHKHKKSMEPFVQLLEEESKRWSQQLEQRTKKMEKTQEKQQKSVQEQFSKLSESSSQIQTNIQTLTSSLKTIETKQNVFETKCKQTLDSMNTKVQQFTIQKEKLKTFAESVTEKMNQVSQVIEKFTH